MKAMRRVALLHFWGSVWLFLVEHMHKREIVLMSFMKVERVRKIRPHKAVEPTTLQVAVSAYTQPTPSVIAAYFWS